MEYPKDDKIFDNRMENTNNEQSFHGSDWSIKADVQIFDQFYVLNTSSCPRKVNTFRLFLEIIYELVNINFYCWLLFICHFSV